MRQGRDDDASMSAKDATMSAICGFAGMPWYFGLRSGVNVCSPSSGAPRAQGLVLRPVRSATSNVQFGADLQKERDHQRDVRDAKR